MLSIDFSPLAQAKARALAAEKGVKVNFELADVHTWQYPEAAFDVVVEIFTQFSTPGERKLKWAGMRRALKPGGLLIIQGYTPKQLEYGTGGPKHVEISIREQCSRRRSLTTVICQSSTRNARCTRERRIAACRL